MVMLKIFIHTEMVGGGEDGGGRGSCGLKRLIVVEGVSCAVAKREGVRARYHARKDGVQVTQSRRAYKASCAHLGWRRLRDLRALVGVVLLDLLQHPVKFRLFLLRLLGFPLLLLLVVLLPHGACVLDLMMNSGSIE